MRLSAGARVPRAAAMLAALVLAATAGCSSGGSAGPSGSTPATGTIVVTSAAFDDGGPIPAQFTCDGAGVSPPLQWSGCPPGPRRSR